MQGFFKKTNIKMHQITKHIRPISKKLVARRSYCCSLQGITKSLSPTDTPQGKHDRSPPPTESNMLRAQIGLLQEMVTNPPPLKIIVKLHHLHMKITNKWKQMWAGFFFFLNHFLKNVCFSLIQITLVGLYFYIHTASSCHICPVK